MNKLLKKINKVFFVIILAAAFYGCGKDKDRQDFVARVEDSYLTEEEISEFLDTASNQQSRKNEFISNWIETELLYKEALEEDIIDEEEYIRIIEQSKKELAKAILFKKIIDDSEIEYSDEDLEYFYDRKKDEFRFFEEAFLFNIIKFTDEDKAILFRNTLIESDWIKAHNVFRGDPDLNISQENRLQTESEIQPVEYITVLQNLLPNETSIVLNSEPNKFVVLQLIRKYNKYEIPEFALIKEKVRKRFLMLSRYEILQDYIKNLHNKYQVEIKHRE